MQIRNFTNALALISLASLFILVVMPPPYSRKGSILYILLFIITMIVFAMTFHHDKFPMIFRR